MSASAEKPLFSVLWLPVLAMVVVITVSNVAVQFPINDMLTWGAFSYPVAFLVTDLTNRAHGPHRARIVAVFGFPIGMAISVLGSMLVDLALWQAIRIALASGFAFICAQMLDIFVFHRLRRMSWWRAPLVSSVSASALDTAIFFSAAFAATGFPWVTWGLGDFGVKVGMALVMLVPFRVFMPLIGSTFYSAPSGDKP